MTPTLAAEMIYCIVSERVVVCEIVPEVAVTVTLAVVGPLGVVPHAVTMLRPTIPMARSRTTRTARRFLQPKRQRARAMVVPGKSGVELGRRAEDLKGTLTVKAVVPGPAVGVTVAGVKAQEDPEGSPEQAKLTAELKPLMGVTVRPTVPESEPAGIVSADGLIAIVKLGGTMLMV